MLLTDSHAHLEAFCQSGELPDVLQRARAAGVARIVAVGGDAPCNRTAIELAGAHPGFIAASAGYDRDQADHPVALDELEALLSQPGVVAVGETGLDYHYSPGNPAAQKALFGAMLEIASQRRLPVIVHSREAEEDTLDLLRAYVGSRGGPPGRVGVLHCFTGSRDFARRVLDLGFLVSFSGILTFRNAAGLREVAAMVPADQLLIETDAPLLAPEPHRGRRNEPAYLVHVAAQLAQVRGCTAEQIADITSRNAERLFALAPFGGAAAGEEC